MRLAYLGIDLGKERDPSAIVQIGVARMPTGKPLRMEDHYLVAGAERVPLGTPYSGVVDRACALSRSPELSDYDEQGAEVPALDTVVIDGTGVGNAIVEDFRAAWQSGRLRCGRVLAVTITGGQRISPGEGRVGVPKKDLCGVVQRHIEQRTLIIDPTLEHAHLLRKELRAFHHKTDKKTGSESFEAWREGDHDDLVLGTGLALWWADLQSKRASRESPRVSFTYGGGRR